MSLTPIWSCLSGDLENLTPLRSKILTSVHFNSFLLLIDWVYYLKGRDYVEQRPRTTLGHGEFLYGPVNPKEENITLFSKKSFWFHFVSFLGHFHDHSWATVGNYVVDVEGGDASMPSFNLNASLIAGRLVVCHSWVHCSILGISAQTITPLSISFALCSASIQDTRSKIS